MNEGINDKLPETLDKIKFFMNNPTPTQLKTDWWVRK